MPRHKLTRREKELEEEKDEWQRRAVISWFCLIILVILLFIPSPRIKKIQEDLAQCQTQLPKYVLQVKCVFNENPNITGEGIITLSFTNYDEYKEAFEDQNINDNCEVLE